MKIVLSRWTQYFFNQDRRFHWVVSILKYTWKVFEVNPSPFPKNPRRSEGFQTKKISTDIIVFSADIKTG